MSSLIPYHTIERNLSNILQDVIVVNNELIIENISESVLHLLGYRITEIVGKSLATITNLDDEVFLAWVSEGFFAAKDLCVSDKNNNQMNVCLSAFYLGLISDINGKIIIQIKNNGNDKILKERLSQKIVEFDNFIYRTSHDMRGPLATIKGLINLSKMVKSEEEMVEYFDLIGRSTTKLDSILNYLTYTLYNHFEYTKEYTNKDFLDKISDRLTKLIELHQIDYNFHIHHAENDNNFVNNDFIVLTFIENLVLVLNSINTDQSPGTKLSFNILDEKLIIKIYHNTNENQKIVDLMQYISTKNISSNEVGMGQFNYIAISILRKCFKFTKGKIQFNADLNAQNMCITIPSDVKK